MFWNLVRYEFKNVNKWFLALYAAVLSLSVIIGIQGSTLSSTYYQDDFWLALISYIVNTLASILCIYFSISIGQLFNEYRTALAVVAYIAIQIVLGFITLNLRIDFDYNWVLSFEIFKDLILSVGFYLGTYYILKNKVNLQ